MSIFSKIRSGITLFLIFFITYDKPLIVLITIKPLTFNFQGIQLLLAFLMKTTECSSFKLQ
jgi:hypothetical protein